MRLTHLCTSRRLRTVPLPVSTGRRCQFDGIRGLPLHHIHKVFCTKVPDMATPVPEQVHPYLTGVPGLVSLSQMALKAEHFVFDFMFTSFC